jgi:hypothetical protein
MKIFQTTPDDGAVELQDVPIGSTFAPRTSPRQLFLLADGFHDGRFQMPMHDRPHVTLEIRMHYGWEVAVAVDLETGKLVAFYPDTMVVVVPSHVVAGKDRA